MRKIAGMVIAVVLAVAAVRFARFALAAESPAPGAAAPAASAPLPPTEAPKHMTLPPGFSATLFAGEPDVVQPIAFTFDDRGRLWVAECLSYPEWDQSANPDSKGHDRIVILEDTDGDGKFDKRTVFADDLVNLSGLQVGFGGVYICSMPYLKFIPTDFNADAPKPTGPAKILLEGWDLKHAGHNVVNGLTWGPDGWLYGLSGIQSKNSIGKPGTPDAERVKFDCAVWRWHPTREKFEVVCYGTTNPFGIDFDAYGQAFFTNCVIKHLWHVIPGAHFQRMYGQDPVANVYQPMESCADHVHFVGNWTDVRSGPNKNLDAGGGHAHVGCMIYLGDNWPDAYRNGIFMCNLHGNRVNNDILEQVGSGYVAHHGKDFLLANDPWFRGITIRYGPDGGVFVSDWTDTGECHNAKVVDRTNGRVYKVTYGKTAPFKQDLSKLSDDELVKLQSHKNEWLVRHARRLLEERASSGKLAAETPASVMKLFSPGAAALQTMHALWAAYAIGQLDEEHILAALSDKEPYVRGWAIRLALDDKPYEPLLGKLPGLARNDPSPVVRLHLASALQRLPLEKRWTIAEGLLSHGEDWNDHNLPLMDWYGIEPLVAADPARAMALAEGSKIPLVRQFIARRAAGIDLAPIVQLLGKSSDPIVQRDLLRGIESALAGQRHVDPPQGWTDAYARLRASGDGEVRDKANALGLLFGDAAAAETLKKVVTDAHASATLRQDTLNALVHSRAPGIETLLRSLLDDKVLAGPALRGLAEIGDAQTPQLILEHYASFNDAAKRDAVQTLAARPASALALLDAVDAGKVPRADLSAYTIRQIAGLNDPKVKEKLDKTWGTVRAASADKVAQAKKYKQMLNANEMKQADLAHGRLVFSKTCAVCHTLFDAGGNVGPNLTGGQRANLDYILENVLDPNALVPRDYQMSIIDTKDGRTLTGTIGDETEKAVTVRTPTGNVVVPKNEIEKRRVSPLSMMPEGLFDALKPDEVRDLVAYLASPQQVPLPEEPKPAAATVQH